MHNQLLSMLGHDKEWHQQSYSIHKKLLPAAARLSSELFSLLDKFISINNSNNSSYSPAYKTYICSIMAVVFLLGPVEIGYTVSWWCCKWLQIKIYSLISTHKLTNFTHHNRSSPAWIIKNNSPRHVTVHECSSLLDKSTAPPSGLQNFKLIVLMVSLEGLGNVRDIRRPC